MQRKRLIVFSDGTWGSPRTHPRSNIELLKIAVATASTSAGILQLPIEDSQLREYHDVKHSVLSLYRSLILNYSTGDELWFFGFSRGAYVVRACIGLIRNCGLLHKEALHKTEDAWHIYQTRWKADATNAGQFRARYSRIPQIRFLGAWETVPPQNAEDAIIHDNILSGMVETACHGLAVDERRRELSPILWSTEPDRSRTEQCWFMGDHRDIGGIGRRPDLSNITLAWIVARATSLGLSVNNDFLENAMSARMPKTEDSSSSTIGNARAGRSIGTVNHDEILHSTAEQRYLRDRNYKPRNLAKYLSRDEQIQLPF